MATASSEILIAQVTAPVSDQAASVATDVGAGASELAAAAATTAAEPNWWILMGLIYAAAGLIAFAASVIGRGNWTDGTPDQLERAAQSHAFNVSGATLLLLICLGFFAVAQFSTLAMGPTVVGLLLTLMVLPVIHLFLGDLFGDPGFDDGTRDLIGAHAHGGHGAQVVAPGVRAADVMPVAASPNGQATAHASAAMN